MSRESEWESNPAKEYPNSDSARWIVSVSRSGDRLTLDDGSKWHVVPSHRLISGNWPRTLRVQVSRVQGRLYTVSAESDRDVQAVYQGLRPLHLDEDAEELPLPAGDEACAATSGPRDLEPRSPAAPTDAER